LKAAKQEEFIEIKKKKKKSSEDDNAAQTDVLDRFRKKSKK